MLDSDLSSLRVAARMASAPPRAKRGRDDDDDADDDAASDSTSSASGSASDPPASPWRVPNWYEGPVDADGKPHGRGRLRLDEDGAWYQGRFEHGAKHGRGTLHFPPDSDDDDDDDGDGDDRLLFPRTGAYVKGTFRDDAVEGRATYHDVDGSWLEGRYARGVLLDGGEVTEYHPGGAVRFRGAYEGGVRHGDGVEWRADGGVLRGTWREGDAPGGAIGDVFEYVWPEVYGVAGLSRSRETRRDEDRDEEEEEKRSGVRRYDPDRGIMRVDDDGAWTTGDVVENEIVGFVVDPDGRDRAREYAEPRERERWRPNGRIDGEKLLFLRDDPEKRTTAAVGRDPERGEPVRGLFLRENDKRIPGFETRGFRARVVVRERWSCRREPFEHPTFGACFALVAERDLPAGAEVTQPPDYVGGWRVDPRTEAGYYYHLAHTPPKTVFASTRDAAGVGVVTVKQHGPWRALYLDGVEQGLAYCDAEDKDENFVHDPTVIGFEYVRAMATAAVAVIGDRLTRLEVDADDDECCSVLCVGLGAGTLAAFAKRASSGRARVIAVEVDEDVVAAAKDVLGLNFEVAGEDGSGEDDDEWTRAQSASTFRVVHADAAAYARRCAEKNRHFDCVFLDAYDGNGDVPAHLTTRAFLESTRAITRRGGCVVANAWNGPPGSPAAEALKRFYANLSRRSSDEDGDEDARVDVQLVSVEGQESNAVVVGVKRCPPDWPREEDARFCELWAGDGGGGARAADDARRATRDRLRRWGADARGVEDAIKDALVPPKQLRVHYAEGDSLDDETLAQAYAP